MRSMCRTSGTQGILIISPSLWVLVRDALSRRCFYHLKARSPPQERVFSHTVQADLPFAAEIAPGLARSVASSSSAGKAFITSFFSIQPRLAVITPYFINFK